jgi:toxin YoeB
VEIEFSPKAQRDLDRLRKAGDTKIQKRISELINSILATPFTGIGKPEPLRFKLAGLWSRRITAEDGLIYEVKSDLIIIHSLKGHY